MKAPKADESQDVRGAEADSILSCLSSQHDPAQICMMLLKQLVLLGKARSVVGPGLRLPVFGWHQPEERKSKGCVRLVALYNVFSRTGHRRSCLVS